MIRVLLITALALAGNDPAQTRFERETRDLARELAKVKLKPLSVEDYDARRATLREQARDPKDFSFVLEKLEESRMDEYPSTWSRTHKRAIYTLEIKLLEQARDMRARAASTESKPAASNPADAKPAIEKRVEQTNAQR